MANFTSNTYQMKREILSFSSKISRKLSKPDKKFTADITYGMLAAGSCLLTDIVDQLHETSKKVNSVERLTRHLNNGVPKAAPVKEKVNFCYYRLAKGIKGILSYAKEGVRLWFRTKRSVYRQLCLKLTA